MTKEGMKVREQILVSVVQSQILTNNSSPCWVSTIGAKYADTAGY